VLLPDFTSRRPGAEQIPGAFAPRKVWLALIFFILALCSKGSAIIFPALAVATVFFVSKGRAPFSVYLKTWPLWLLAVGYIVIWMTFLHITGFSTDETGDPAFFVNYTSNIMNRILTSLATLPVYAGLIVWPAGLHMEWRFPVFIGLQAVQPVLGLLMVGVGFIQVLWTGLRVNKGIVPQWALALSFGLLWFAAALFPATGIAFPVNGLIAERRLYMPTMGLFLGVTQTVADFLEKKKNGAQPVVSLLVLVLALSPGIRTFFQNEVWRNTETLYQNIVQNDGFPNNILVSLGGFYLEHREFDKAISLAQNEINYPIWRSARLQAAPHMLLARALLQFQPDIDGDASSPDDIIRFVRTSPHLPEVIDELDKVLQIYPDYILAHQYLAIIYRYQGNNQMADLHDKKAGEISKNLEAEAHVKLAMAQLHIPLNKDGISFSFDINALPSYEHIPEAIAELEKATQDNPDYYIAHAILARLYRRQGGSQLADFHEEKASDILQKQGDSGR
jgi:tetratricopeptide (TPR) repeat protein